MRQFFVPDTLRWAPADGIPGVKEVGLARRAPDAPEEEVVGYDGIVEGRNYLYGQRKARVTKALQKGLLGITFELKEDFWFRNCVPASSLKPIPEKKPRKVPKPAPPAAATTSPAAGTTSGPPGTAAVATTPTDAATATTGKAPAAAPAAGDTPAPGDDDTA
jgi:hypothetical protein